MASRLLYTLLIFSCAAPAIALADGRLSVSADLAQVNIGPRPEGRSFVRLPSIEFAFSIEAKCQEDWTAGSVSLSIADTRASFSAEQIEKETSGEIKFTVPQKQIAPLALADFCSDDDAVTTRRRQSDQLVVRDVLLLHASLLCASDGAEKMTYISRPLDILLTCELPEEETGLDPVIDP